MQQVRIENTSEHDLETNPNTQVSLHLFVFGNAGDDAGDQMLDVFFAAKEVPLLNSYQTVM